MISFSAAGIFFQTTPTKPRNAGVLEPGDLAKVHKFLGGISPMSAAFDHNFVREHRRQKRKESQK